MNIFEFKYLCSWYQFFCFQEVVELIRDHLFLPRNVKKAIKYFKDASSFDDGRAKNNLGIIYKTGDGVEKSNDSAIIYFEEAIKKNDFAAAFNLIHTKFYEEQNNFDYEEALNLLILAWRGHAPNSMDLLCLIIVDKYKNDKKNVTLSMIENDICLVITKFTVFKEDVKNNFIHVFSKEIYKKIKEDHLDDDDDFYSKLYEETKKINLIYTYSFEIIPRHLLEEYKQINERINPSDSLLKDLNKEFYEGFNI